MERFSHCCEAKKDLVQGYLESVLPGPTVKFPVHDVRFYSLPLAKEDIESILPGLRCPVYVTSLK